MVCIQAEILCETSLFFLTLILSEIPKGLDCDRASFFSQKCSKTLFSSLFSQLCFAYKGMLKDEIGIRFSYRDGQGQTVTETTRMTTFFNKGHKLVTTILWFWLVKHCLHIIFVAYLSRTTAYMMSLFLYSSTAGVTNASTCWAPCRQMSWEACMSCSISICTEMVVISMWTPFPLEREPPQLMKMVCNFTLALLCCGLPHCYAAEVLQQFKNIRPPTFCLFSQS